MIRCEHLVKRFPGGQSALAGLNFEMADDEMVFLTGHSGAGKSTLLRILGTLDKPTRGRVTFNNVELGRLKNRQLPKIRRDIGMIFQDHRLLMDRSVFDNVALPLVISGYRRHEIRHRVRAALDLVSLAKHEKKYPVALSSGEQQRVGIARAIVTRPALLLADEPTGNLDPELSAEIMQLFCALNETGLSLMVASHDLHLVKRLRKRVLVLAHGELIDDFRPLHGDAHP